MPTELTANIDLQFTEVCSFFCVVHPLNNEISVRRQVASTLQVDCGSVTNSARVLTADGVVPRGRCRDSG